MRDGLLLVDKPLGVTSHDVVLEVRKKLGVRQVGHTGTLDPIARGLLVLLVGGATKHQHALQGHEKTYEAVLRLGVQTDTADADGKAVRTAPVPPVDHQRLLEVLASFVGPLSQTPPAYSAVKVHGRPAYWWARRQQPVTLAARTVRLSEMTLVGHDAETVTFRVRCSAGTYVRTLAESIAERLGTLGHLTRLVRLEVGPWNLQDAKPLSWIVQSSAEAVARELRPVVTAPPRSDALR
jgi:tRNA pseudouridine55 synthase